MQRRVALWLLRAVAIASFAAFTASVLWYYYLYRTSPDELRIGTDHVVRMWEHGTVFYIRPWENVLHQGLLWGGVTGSVLIVLIDGRAWKRRRRDKRTMPDAVDTSLHLRERTGRGYILTIEIEILAAVGILLCALAIGTGGRILFDHAALRY